MQIRRINGSRSFIRHSCMTFMQVRRRALREPPIRQYCMCLPRETGPVEDRRADPPPSSMLFAGAGAGARRNATTQPAVHRRSTGDNRPPGKPATQSQSSPPTAAARPIATMP